MIPKPKSCAIAGGEEGARREARHRGGDAAVALLPNGAAGSNHLPSANPAGVRAGPKAVPAGAWAVPAGARAALVGTCIDPRHPLLQGRARIRWTGCDGVVDERWLPMLMTVTVRAEDHVLLLRPDNWDEPVIVGAVDGFSPRPSAGVSGGPVLELQDDEEIRVRSRDGQELLALAMSEAGPVVRLLSAAVALDLPGKLRLSAESIELRARKGEVVVAATDDVLVTGATIRLN